MALGIPNFKQTIADIKPKRKNLSSKAKRLRREASRDYTSYPTYNIDVNRRMTILEYQRKLSNLMVSDAPIEQIKEAIETLRSQYETSSSTEVARQQFEEAQPDTSDIGGHS